MNLTFRRDPVDPDIDLITLYLANELDPLPSAAVEERLATDMDFYIKVAPIVKAWRVPAEYRPDRFALDQPTLATPGRLRRIGTRVAAAAVLVFFIFGAGMYAWVTISGFVQNKQDELVGRAPSGGTVFGSTVTSTAGATATAKLPRGSVVTLTGESRYRFSATPPGFPHYVMSALDGEASFEITPTEGVVEIVTSRATIHLDAGRYAVRCAPGCDALLIAVGAGVASVKRDSTDEKLVLTSGERGIVPRTGAPRKATPADSAVRWPVIVGSDTKPTGATKP
jgi:hypothetical protein